MARHAASPRQAQLARTVGRMATAALRDVELVSTGTWAASTGQTTITRADLDAILAAAADPQIDHAPIKLGHFDPRFDGEPAAGWVRPTRIERKGGRDVLYGDLIGMPAALAQAAPTAYRRRSAELKFRAKTPGGKTYAAVLTGLALLGVQAPAVKGLADVLALYSAGTHQPLDAEAVGDVQIVEGLSPALTTLFSACAAELPADRLDRLAALLGAADTASVPPPEIDAPNDDTQTTATEGGAPMALTEERVREILHLETDADVEAALRGLAAASGETVTPETPLPGTGTSPAEQPTTAPTVPAEPTEVPAAPAEPAAAPSAQPEPELVTLSAGTWAEVQRNAAAGAAAAAALDTQRRADLISAAVREGRVAPAERALFAAAIDRDEEGTVALLSGLTPRFPVTEIGSDTAPLAQLSAGASDAWDAWERATFPALPAAAETR